MPSGDELGRRIRETFASELTIGVGDTVRESPSPDSTVEPPRLHADSAVRNAVRLLRPISTKGDGLEIERTLGEGGMGVVHLATQVALGRHVAVKALKADHHGENEATRLLQEAWVTGALEHPNVIPIHDIGVDDRGSPMIVMKRIEGRAWTDMMRDEAAVRALAPMSDLLEWNLRTLGQVATAIHFAHSRGIVHRDLKPDNVMIGTFGEIYVLDWGIAVSTRDDGTGRFPLASQATAVAGTPCYMAPEMLGGEPVMISERTDVYLLGAILFEILAGRPPHDGASFGAIIAQVIATPPEPPESAPPELAAICKRAMALSPDARYESALDLRMAIEAFVEHRGSAQLTRDTEQWMGDLATATADSPKDAIAHRTRLYQLFGAVRFGFREALATWPENAAAREGLAKATRYMIEYELRQGDPRAALPLMAELETPDVSIKTRIDQALELKAAAEKERETFAAIGRQLNPAVGQRTRVFLIVAMGLLWSLTPFLRAALWGETGEPYVVQIAWTLGFTVILGGLAFWARDTLRSSALNRRLSASMGFAMTGQLVLGAGGYLGMVSPGTIQVGTLFLWFCVSSMVVITLERRLLPTAFGHLAGFLIVSLQPSWIYYAMSLGNVVMAVNAIAIWGPQASWAELRRRG